MVCSFAHTPQVYHAHYHHRGIFVVRKHLRLIRAKCCNKTSPLTKCSLHFFSRGATFTHFLVPIHFHLSLSLDSYEIGVAYGYFYDIHVTTYGEAILLALQSHMIVYLTVKYSGDWSLENGAWLVANGAFIAAIVTKSIPASIIPLLLVGIQYVGKLYAGGEVLCVWR